MLHHITFFIYVEAHEHKCHIDPALENRQREGVKMAKNSHVGVIRGTALVCNVPHELNKPTQVNYYLSTS